MSKLYFTTIANLADEPLEVYWLAGLRCSAANNWFVVLALRGIQSGRFVRAQLPIGTLPMLTLGRVFERGELSTDPCRGVVASACIADVSSGREATSASIDANLYSFGRHTSGVQRLFEYQTEQGRILVPVIELVRFLFLHNKTLANCVMRPGALSLLFTPQSPGLQTTRKIQFTGDMPSRCLSHDFVREFAWLALEPGARRAWDSVETMSRNKDYVLFSPPPIKRSIWEFRGVQHKDAWLVLELLAIRGRILPCSFIEYSHSKLVRTIRVDNNQVATRNSKRTGSSADENAQDQNGGARLEVDDESDESGSDRTLKLTDIVAKTPNFENAALVRAVRERTRQVHVRTRSKSDRLTGGGGLPAVAIRVSAGERGLAGHLPPIEFNILPPVCNARLGTLESLHDAARHMCRLAPELSIMSAPCFVKEGRTFSRIGRDRRMALLVLISRPQLPPIALVDVERTGVPALALLAIMFKNPSASTPEVEAVVKTILDGLVDRGGSWCHASEKAVLDLCGCERHPKALFPRAQGVHHATLWAARLIERLGLVSA